tara:strand:- start:1587 stop:2006 length:420 start_codon:yes stop_codon:yes gene_type:complete
MQYWLLKTEPEEWSWKDQVKSGKKGSIWDGVRNFQARNNLKSMSINDQCFFYHSGKEKSIVGIVRVIKEYFDDSEDKRGKFGSIMVQSYRELRLPVSLKDIKNHRLLANLPLIKQSRLSVMTIDSKSWKIICKMGKINI